MIAVYGSRMLSGDITQPGSSQTAVTNCWAGLQQPPLRHGQHLECIYGSPFPILFRQESLRFPHPRTSCRGVLLPRDTTTVPAHSQGEDGTSWLPWLPALLLQPWARSRCTVQGPAGFQQQGSAYLLLLALLGQHWWPSMPRRCSAPCLGYKCRNSCTQQTIKIYHSW